ncbi:hypothetical protein [Rhodovarius lipocyclicus]|uniref:hypothetical protein n=1 Tax=Rhodovarius lipocyclicus TaxID=268410 RepID=UPI001358CA33|nr:hypothetical protein [Rhodovarius lipocyclicus]
MATRAHSTPAPDDTYHGRRSINPADLDAFVTPLLYGTQILSMLAPTIADNSERREALEWFALFLEYRARELDAFTSGHRPKFQTDIEFRERATALDALPTQEEAHAALLADLAKHSDVERKQRPRSAA